VEAFDGKTLPYSDKSFDAVLIVDVLHHTRDPLEVLREAARVCRGNLLIKDHLADPWLAVPRLRFMDWFGNARHGVALTYEYWTRKAWTEAFLSLDLTVEDWIERLGLYPVPASWVFEDSLHFVARLRRN
jgi:ubiquinone/menaquinone biosynthesis C-methylase UbiE